MQYMYSFSVNINVYIYIGIFLFLLRAPLNGCRAIDGVCKTVRADIYPNYTVYRVLIPIKRRNQEKRILFKAFFGLCYFL